MRCTPGCEFDNRNIVQYTKHMYEIQPTVLYPLYVAKHYWILCWRYNHARRFLCKYDVIGVVELAEKEDRRTKITKQMLKESLLELLKKNDIHHIKIRELCELADVNRSTFYKYYASQYELLQDMENDWLQRFDHYLDSMTSNQKNFPDDILVFLEENLEFSRLLLNSNVDVEFPQKLFAQPCIKRLIDGSLPIDNGDSETEYINRFYVNGGYNIIMHWLNKEERESPKEMVQIMQRILQHIQH